MSDYQQEVMRMRMERKQAEARDHYEMWRQEYNDALDQRENAALQFNDDPDFAREEWNRADQRMEEAERNLAPHLQAQQPQAHPAATQWDARHRPFIDRMERRLGVQGAMQAFAEADGYLCRPRIQGENNPARTGMGLQRNSPAYFKAMDDLLELHSGDFFGVKFDSKETGLTPNESCEISGVSPNEWNRQARIAWQHGKIGTGK